MIEWKNTVRTAVEEQNRKRLIEDCQKKVDGNIVTKTKTAHILEKIKDTSYTRKSQEELKHLSKKETKTLMIARLTIYVIPAIV